ncbi:MAG: alpha/beta fold hydrolase [Proteobacteria bacterium]|nr:alpha/beta fold hydrolase [Pseudomonadota bacterium]
MPRAFDTIVLIHGLWMTPRCWEHWIPRYQAHGYQVVARGWPGMDADPDALRRDPGNMASLGITEVVEHYEEIIEGLDRPPLIVGHSFGGLITQILLDRGFGVAGVAIASAAAKGVLILPFSTIRVVAPALSNPLNAHRAVPLTAEQFHYAFCNTLTAEESRAVYERYAVPGPDHVLFQAALANFNPHAASMVDFGNAERAPLLMVAGELDHISPPAIVTANYRLYARSSAVTDLHQFPGRSHYILGQGGWEEVADYALAWGERRAAEAERRPPVGTSPQS